MVNGALGMFTDALDLGFERGDARVQLLDRKGIEILAAERDEGIVGTSGQEIVCIHVQSVDRFGLAVNKRSGETGG